MTPERVQSRPSKVLESPTARLECVAFRYVSSNVSFGKEGSSGDIPSDNMAAREAE